MPVKLPNAEQAIVERGKIVDYLLSVNVPKDKNKVGFFSHFGFHLDRWEEFAAALKAHGAAYAVIDIRESDKDVRYGVVGTIETPDGRNPRIKTAWQIMRGDTVPRFLTAHPYRSR